GYINALDRVSLWPDQHGLVPVDSGVAILTQSSNIAINLTMQKRALPIAYMVTVGNQAQISQAELAACLLDDTRVTAVGLHIEGFSDLRAWEMLAQKAHRLDKPIIALKVGRSEQARAATLSHTASLAGHDAGADALLRRLGIARLDSLPAFLETLKLLHVTGKLASGRIASISCSGGEASLAADTVHRRNLSFPALSNTQSDALRAALGPMVALANPLDYHTYIWRDSAAMARAWAAMIDPSLALTLLIVDFPRSDRCDPSDWDCAIDAALAAKAQTGANIAMVATLPELMPEDIAMRLMAGGVVPLCGLQEAICAAEAAAFAPIPVETPLFCSTSATPSALISEAQAKSRLAGFGLLTPRGRLAKSPQEARDHAMSIGYPVVLKGDWIAHKTEAGAVALGLGSAASVACATARMPCTRFLVEEMIDDGVAELLVGITRDAAHGSVLTMAAGGTFAELFDDSTTLLLPVREQDVIQSLHLLKIAKILTGYRGRPGADIGAVVAAVMALQSYVLAQGGRVEEIEINPLICTPTRAVAADLLLREAP
ncbi:MAG: acetate--CoA ligase family protein, partial [Halocynthiibacter sp.]